MFRFSLRSQRTGNYKEFTILELLRLLGDTVNDEIWLENGEDVYNLSSYRDSGSGEGGGSGGGTLLYWSVEQQENIAGHNTFFLQYQPATDVLMVLLNGLSLSPFKDFLIDGKTIKFSYNLNSQDNLKFIYQHV